MAVGRRAAVWKSTRKARLWICLDSSQIPFPPSAFGQRQASFGLVRSQMLSDAIGKSHISRKTM